MRCRVLVSFRRRQDRLYLCQDATGGLTELGVTPAFDHACAEDKSLDFFAVEHQRWKVEVLAEPVPDPGLAEDGHT